jgi:DNA-binding response OmpR family regulator
VFQRNVLTVQNCFKPKVLAVSQDQLLANIRRSILTRVGYTVTATENATEALIKLATQSFDLLILCHTLPNREKKLLESESKAKHIPVLTITDSDAASEKKSQVGSLDQAMSFLSKVRALAPTDDWKNRRPRVSAA